MSLATGVPAAAADQPLTVSSHTISQGASLTVSGSGCALPDTSATTVQVDLVNAFGDPSTIHTDDVAQGNVSPVPAGGTWTISIRVDPGAQSGQYDLLASCLKGSFPAVTGDFGYANSVITVGTPVTSPSPAAPTTTAAVATSAAPAKVAATSAAKSTAPTRAVAVASPVTAAPVDPTTAPATAAPVTSRVSDPATNSLDAQAVSSAALPRTTLAAARVNHNGRGSSALLALTLSLVIVAVAGSAGMFVWRRRGRPTR